ncbi:MAG: hypothetical protein JJU21_17830, partial [Salinarimonas sp.]|nr:hypothetical protein [Salinarimonas sp.]
HHSRRPLNDAGSRAIKPSSSFAGLRFWGCRIECDRHCQKEIKVIVPSFALSLAIALCIDEVIRRHTSCVPGKEL